ncbi:MAG: lasso peptide biosynthesis B2 protein [Acidobacteriia bacterium]|nr:lasso peptide biosynthesis B2 protein [Terriglobia bacterium]
MYGLARTVRHFVSWPAFEQMLFPFAWLGLGISRLVVIAVPFRSFAPCLGASREASSWIPLLHAQAELRALSIGKVVRVAARYTPWTTNCFPQAITAAALLTLYRVPYSLFLGVQGNPGKLSAHAWVAAGRVRVTGGPGFGKLVVVGCFTRNVQTSSLPRTP